MTPPIWDVVIGQQHAVDVLTRAVDGAGRLGQAGNAMTHAWLITGPPGSGRSTAAASFAAALVCPQDGCGACEVCRMAPLGGHPDVEMVSTEAVYYRIDEARELVRRSSMAPIKGRWHVIVVEDADRMRDDAVTVLLKALEEPPPHTVWVLCAPSVEDLLPTITSRLRHVPLVTPSSQEVTDLLVAQGVDAALASYAARASQGHIGRARALARESQVRERRHEVMRTPFALHDIPTCFASAAELLTAATQDARSITDPMDDAEEERVLAQFGDDASVRGRAKRMADAELKRLQARQKSRRTRTIRDQVDRALVDLAGLYRDVLVVQCGGGVQLINEEMRSQLEQLAVSSTQNDTGRRLQAISYCRKQLEANVTPLLALESLMVELKDPWIRFAALG